jgi:O-succinylbenzoic acid--CoA ligase
VSAADSEAAWLQTVEPAQVVAALSESLHGGPPIAPLPADAIERARAVSMLQPSKPVHETDAAVVVSTSGSTGAPKGVVLSRAAIRASVEASYAWLGGPGDWVLALPAYYIAGLMVIARACLGGTRVVPARSDLSDLPDVGNVLSARRYISLVPAQLARALRHGDLTESLRSFSAVLVGGAPAPAGLLNRAAGTGIRVVTSYGMSETCGGCVYDGKPLAGVDVELTDHGRIMIKSSSLFSGYRLRPDLTAEALTEGRFTTQDVGRWETGRLVVLGRMDDIVITGGHKVDLVDVEQPVQQWAARRGAHGAVVAVPDAVWGTTIIAVSDSPGSLADLQIAVAEALPAYAVPRELVHIDQLPWLASGKPDRVAIQSMIMKVRDARQVRA